MPVDLVEIRADLNALSETISTQVRSIALGLVALVWALLTGLKDTPLAVDGGTRRQLLWVALVAVGALVIDYSQYLFGYLDSLRILRKAERENKSQTAYSKSSPYYRARAACYWIKQLTILSGASWMGLIILRLLL